LSRLGSPQAGSRRVAIAKPKNDIYVALLAIALGALAIACILLAIELHNYEWNVNPKVELGPSRVTGNPHQSLAFAPDSLIQDHGRSGSVS